MNTRTQAKRLAQRPYVLVTSIEQNTDNQPIYFARVLELDGCFGQGETEEEAIKDLQLAMVDFIASLLDDGIHIPEPSRLASTTLGTGTEKNSSFVEGINPKHKSKSV